MIVLWFPVPLKAQETISPLVFNTYECDFGEVDESGGTLFYTFHFMNGGASPVQISNVSASCTCVSVSYPREIIERRATGEISVALNPARTMGDVVRTVDIILLDGRPGVTLTLKARVIPSEYDVEDAYRVALPEGIRLTSISQRFGYVAAESMEERRIDVINTSDSAVTIETDNGQGGLLTVSVPERLGPGEAGSLILRYTLPEGTAALGMHQDKVLLLLNGRPCNRLLEVSCIGVGETAKGRSPSLQIQPASPVMKKSLIGKDYSGSYTIRNTGTGDLVILKADLPAGVVSNVPDGTVVKPGGSRKVTLRSAAAEFRFGLVTNDPSRPYKEIGTSTK